MNREIRCIPDPSYTEEEFNLEEVKKWYSTGLPFMVLEDDQDETGINHVNNRTHKGFDLHVHYGKDQKSVHIING